MRSKIINIAFLALIFSLPVSAQETISANDTTGCDTLSVTFSVNNHFSIEQYETIRWLISDTINNDIQDSIINTGELSFDYTFETPGRYSVRCVLKKYSDPGNKVVFKDNWITVSITPLVDFDYYDQTPDASDELTFAFENRYFTPLAGMDLDFTWEWYLNGDLLVQDTNTDSIAVFDFSTQGEGLFDVSLKIEDQIGCVDSTSRTIKILKELLVPVAFSPNGDGDNDYLEIYIPVDDIYHFRIFTREGLQVYYSTGPAISWDGKTIGEKDVPEGIYYYTIESEGSALRSPQKGFLYVFR